MTTATDSPHIALLCRTCGNHYSGVEGKTPCAGCGTADSIPWSTGGQERRQSSWIWTKDRLPDRVPNRSYSQVSCLVWYKNEVQILVYNHEHRCWDDETGDDYVCDPLDVEAWMPLPSPPEERK